MRAVLCIPTLTRPYRKLLDSIEAELPLLEEAGVEHSIVHEIGCPYISAARNTMLRKALDAKADVIVFLDHDLSWTPGCLLKLIQAPGDVVAGNYRFKREPEEYMGSLYSGPDERPILGENGMVQAYTAPAGFLKVTKECVSRFMREYPELIYGEPYYPYVDLFNHGAYKGTWWGEDMAFSRRWNECGGEVWVIPDLDLTHWDGDKPYPGNFHKFLLRQPGGSEAPVRWPCLE